MLLDVLTLVYKSERVYFVTVMPTFRLINVAYEALSECFLSSNELYVLSQCLERGYHLFFDICKKA